MNNWPATAAWSPHAIDDVPEAITAIRESDRGRETATVREHLDDADALVYRLERDPADPVAGDLLEAVYTRRGEREQVVTLLLDRAEAAADAGSRAAFLVRAARIYRTELADPAAARLVLVTALAGAPGDGRIHDELDAVVCADGQLGEVRAAYADAAAAIPDPALSGSLWLRVAALHVMEYGPPSAVCAALVRIEALALDQVRPMLELCERLVGEPMVLDALVALYRRLGDAVGASRVLARSISGIGDPGERARRHHAIAELALSRGDDLEAEWHLAEALRLAPSRSATRAALAELYRRQGQSRRAAALLEEARAAAHNPVDRVNLACQAAAIYAGDLGERTRALHLYEMVLASDPERAEAAAPLAERYWQRGAYAQLEPLIELLVRRGGDAELSYRAGRTALELGKPERAREHLRAAAAAAPGRADILRAASAAARAVGRLDEAFVDLAAAFDLEQRGAGAGEQADLLADLASIAEARGEPDGALDLYRDALRRSPSHPVALAGATSILRLRRDPVAVGELLEAAAGEATGDRRGRILAELAALQAGGLGDPAAAIDLYRQALAIIPDDHEVLTGMAELFAATGAWDDAVQVLTTLAGIESDRLRRGRYFQIAGQLARGRLPDDRTAGLFTSALDCFFESGEPPESHRCMCMRAFSDLEALLRKAGAFKALERAYRTMIRRLGRDSIELPDLWTRLGVLYRENLGQAAAAIESFELAAALDSGRATRRRVLIDLYEGLAPEQIDALVTRRWTLLCEEPTAAEHYRALALLHRSAGRRDHTFLALRAVHALGAATPEEIERVAPHRGPVLTSPLTREHRARLRHQDEDGCTTGVLALVTEAIAADLAVAPRRLPLRDDLSPRFQALRVLYQEVAALVGVVPPLFFVQPELDVELVYANIAVEGSSAQALVAGGRLLRASRAESIHALARVLAYARPAYILCVLLGEPGALDAALDAALMVGGYRGRLAPSPHAHHLAAAIDRRLPAGFREHLTGRVQSIHDPREALAIGRWSAAVSATCRRTALLVSGDLPIALDAAGREPPAAIDPVADLLLHSCSEEHAQLRRSLGLAVA